VKLYCDLGVYLEQTTGSVLIFVLSGEFTLRAFLNGRLDLAQAENVSRLISAKSAAAADSALAGIQACHRIMMWIT
jgi:tRNA U34 5-carboxymethylaminomethyl modifying GTPase MnmE/TrmE